MAKTVSQVFGMENIGHSELGKVAAVLEVPSTNVITSDQMLGIEVEVENYDAVGKVDSVWRAHGDGSLRNGGTEFVTQPIKACDAPKALQNLLKDFLSPNCCFSPRTSVHVHFNMLPYSVDVVKNITMLYACFEPLFFRFTGRGRAKNIYCIPIVETSTLHHFERYALRDVAGRWSKYTSLNLLPLTTQGTIEARHMHGTFDVQKLCIWIRLWCKLIEYCLKNEVTTVRKLIAGMELETDYQQLLNQIFGDDAVHLKYRDWMDIEASVTTVKTAYTNIDTQSRVLAERDLEKGAYFTFKAK